MKEIDIIENKETQISEFSTNDSVFKTFETTINVFETELEIADDVSSFFSENSKNKNGHVSAFPRLGKKKKNDKVKDSISNAVSSDFSEDEIKSESGHVSAFSDNYDSVIASDVISGDFVTEEETPYSSYSYDDYTEERVIDKSTGNISASTSNTAYRKKTTHHNVAKDRKKHIKKSKDNVYIDKLDVSGVYYDPLKLINQKALSGTVENQGKKTAEKVAKKVGKKAAKLAGLTALEVAKDAKNLTKKALKKAEQDYVNAVQNEIASEGSGVERASSIFNTIQGSENKAVWSQGEAVVEEVKQKGCFLVAIATIICIVMLIGSFASGAIKVILKAAEMKTALASYMSIFEGKSAYSGTGKAKNLSEYADTVERLWIETYCEKYDMQGWEEVCLAICMTESGGAENSQNPMGVVSSYGNYVTGFFSGSTEGGIDAGVKALKNCAYYYEYYTKNKPDPQNTDCILIVANCYAQGIDFARYVAEYYHGSYSDKANDNYAIEKNNEGANNMFYGSYYINGSDGTKTLGGRTVPPIYNNFLHYFDLTKSQTKKSSSSDNLIDNILSFFSSSSGSGLGAIAQNELGNYGDKYWEWCHSGQVDWCAIFVSWCAEQGGLSGEIPFSMSAGMIDNLDQTKCRGESYTPKSGDLITFDDTPPYKVSHIAIVSRVENGRVYYIGGNQGEGDYSRNTGAWCSYSIVSESSIPIGDSDIYKYYVVG